MIISKTSFDQAEKEFKDFLAENNLPTEILWVFVEDTFSQNSEIYKTHFWVKLPLPIENKSLVKKEYEIGQQKGLGIGLSAFALCEEKVCCALIIPKDDEDSEFLGMSRKYLKFSFVKDMPIAKAVKSSLKWSAFKFLPFWYKQGNFLVYLQSKKDLQF